MAGAPPVRLGLIASAVALTMLTSPVAHANKPAADEAELPPPDSRSHVPRDGKGALTFGSLLLIGGAASTANSFYNLIGPGSWGVGFASLGLGVIGIGTGIGVTIKGVRRQRRYLEWQSSSSLRPPTQGNALLASGTMTLVASFVIVTTSSANWLLYQDTPASVIVGWSVSGTGFALGTALLLAGTVYRGRFERWQKAPLLLPTASFGPQGFGLGLSGRF